MSISTLVLVSCYELGHQPLGIAWASAFLRRAGFDPQVLDLSVEPFDPDQVRAARVVVISVPMHTALRLGVRVAKQVRRLANLAELYLQQGRQDEAEVLLKRAIGIWDQVLDAMHPAVARALSTLALLYLEQGRLTEAETLQRRSPEILEHALDVPEVVD